MAKKDVGQIIAVVVFVGLALSGIIFTPSYFVKKNEFKRTLRNMPLPVKMLYYYDYIRQNQPRVLTTDEFNTYIILHDTEQYNHFKQLDKELGDIWQTDNSMTEFEVTLYMFQEWSVYWKKNHTSYELYNNLLSKITYYDDNYFVSGTDQYYDYAKSAIETIFSSLGDCEDHVILTATFLEAAGYETIIGGVSDHNESGLKDDFDHGFLWVKVENFSYPYLYADLWRFGEGEYEWLLLEPTGSSVYGSTVSWIAFYDNHNFTRWEDIFQWEVIAPPGDSSLELNEFIPSHE